MRNYFHVPGKGYWYQNGDVLNMRSKFIIESFWQRHSNCASVAFIKAIMIRYGFRKAFRATRMGNAVVVTLKDGWSVALTSTEIRLLNRRNGILYRRYSGQRNRKAIRRIRSFTELCFAILVRSIQLRGYAGKEYTATEAIDALVHEGVETVHFHNLFGLKRTSAVKITARNLTALKRTKGALLYNKKHIAVAGSGYFEDIGVAVPIGHEIPELLYGKATHWYKLK